ncbi:MAG TPA: hypothetical protein VK474_11620 [Chthoniobacterales bacterium]|nr:hypothetical protein [Chthoniobacterales bacterium]
MKQQTLWELFCAKNPSFAGRGNVTMSAAGLRKLFDQTWERAHAAGFANGQAYAELHAPKEDHSLFGKIFGARS